MKKLFVLLALISLLYGCAFKSVMEGEADDILKARIYSFDDYKWLVMLEALFQATSKESGRGLTVISGFNDLLISV